MADIDQTRELKSACYVRGSEVRAVCLREGDGVFYLDTPGQTFQTSERDCLEVLFDIEADLAEIEGFKPMFG